MKIKNNNVMVATQFLGKINGSDHGIRFAFKTSTIINRVNTAVEIIEKLRKEVADKYVLKNEAGEIQYADKDKKYIQLSKEGGEKLEELFACESEIEFEQFTMEELEAAGVKVKPIEIPFIGWLIKSV